MFYIYFDKVNSVLKCFSMAFIFNTFKHFMLWWIFHLNKALSLEIVMIVVYSHNYWYTDPMHSCSSDSFELQRLPLTFEESFSISYISIVEESLVCAFIDKNEWWLVSCEIILPVLFIVDIKFTFVLLNVLLTRKNLLESLKELCLAGVRYTFDN